LGNTEVGIVAAGANNTIVENVVAFNGVGVRAANLVAKGNWITRNSIFENVGAGIDLGFDSITANDVPPDSVPPDLDDGANGAQNYPVLTSVIASGGGTRAQGTLQSTPNSSFRLEFFANASRDENLFVFGVAKRGEFTEGQSYVGSHDVVTDANGFVSCTGPRNNTSEFSALAPLGGCSLTVTNTADSGIGSLRESIFCSLIADEVQTVGFAVRPDDPRHFTTPMMESRAKSIWRR
jgi:hypothetical protein